MNALESFKPTALPAEYRWVLEHATKDGPEVMRQALALHGLAEIVGPKHNPAILEMADALGGPLDSWYDADEKPWCALGVSYILLKSGFEPLKGFDAVRARSYAKWGHPVGVPSFGDVLSFWRGSPTGTDGHVGFYVAEDKAAFHVLGFNQGNRCKIDRLEKNRLIAARRCPWKISQPAGVKPFIVAATGTLSRNEA